MVYQVNGAIHLLNKEDLELNSISKFKRQFRKRKNILLSLVYILPRKRMWAFSRRSRAEMAKKGTEKVCCKGRDVVLLLCERYRCRRRRRILSTLICPNWDNCRCTKCSQHVAWEKSQASINPRGGGGVWPTWSWWYIFYRNEDKDLAECSYAKKEFGLDRFRRRSNLISFESKL